MINRVISNEVMDLLQKGLDASALQHNVIANNLANVDTPGFKRSEVLFGEKLRAAMDAREAAGQNLELSATNDRHFQIQPKLDLDQIKPEVVLQNKSSLRNDQNNVDIDVEMAKLAQNTVVYQTLAQLTQNQFTELKSAIREGK
jgi:flagellar basal-body rod protein FlgB